MYPISASQIKAARALLGWSQDDLADAANLSRATVRSVELGYAIRAGNIDEIHKTLEKNGIELLDGDGVRRQPDGKRDFTGTDSCDRFFDDVLRVLKERGGELICFIQSQDMITKVSGATRRTNFERLEQVQAIADVKCLLSDNVSPPFSTPSFQVRVLPEEPTIIPSSCFAYGDQWVFAYQDSSMHFVFVVIQKASFVSKCQNYFLPRWHVARPLQASMEPQKGRA
jgi:transcriptional regulator with XRE-family HTH domain